VPVGRFRAAFYGAHADPGSAKPGRQAPLFPVFGAPPVFDSARGGMYNSRISALPAANPPEMPFSVR